MRIKTNFSGPYIIKEINRRSPPYIHLVCIHPGNNYSEFYLNYFVEAELRSKQKTYCGLKTELDYDYIIILPNEYPIQCKLFEE
jgi:hypothetical protein